MEFQGSIRIRNPQTLQRWIDNGRYQKQIDNGYTFAVGCGRFRVGECECNKCRKSTNSPLKAVIENIKR